MNIQFYWGFWAKSWEYAGLRFLYGFLKSLGRGYGFISSGFPPYSILVNSNSTVEYVRGCVSLKKYIRGWVSLKKYKYQGKAVEVTVNSKEENLRLLSGFRLRIQLWQWFPVLYFRAQIWCWAKSSSANKKGFISQRMHQCGASNAAAVTDFVRYIGSKKYISFIIFRFFYLQVYSGTTDVFKIRVKR
jgi:hypothetical protein